MYTEKAVNKIHLYSYQAEKHLVTFTLNKEEWDINILPSVEVIKAREKQYQDKALRLQLIERTNMAIPRMIPSIKAIVETLVQRIKN